MDMFVPCTRICVLNRNYSEFLEWAENDDLM